MKAFPAMAVVGLLLMGCGSGKSVPPGTVKNDQFAYSLVPPAGWIPVTTENAGEFIARHGSRLMASTKESFLKPTVGKTTFVIAYVKVDTADPMLPVIAVVHNSVGLAQVGANELQKSRMMMKGKMQAAGISDFNEQSSTTVELDGLRAVEIYYLATVDSFKLHAVELMIASKTLTHFLSLHSDQAGWAANEAVFNQVRASFRSHGGR